MNQFILDLKNNFLAHAQHASGKQKPAVLVGLSGGADSVFLLKIANMLVQDNLITLAAAHLNHGWRARAADDAAWCKMLCDNLQIPIFVGTADAYGAVEKNGSLEAQGRRMRKLFFEEIQSKNNFDCVALGHHIDDQVETFFIKLIRGSSVHGLGGIKKIAGSIIRPLLTISKDQITSWLRANNQPWLEDETNNDVTFLRNNIRHTVIPALRQADDRAIKNIIATMNQLQDDAALLQICISQKIDSFLETENTYNLELFKKEPVLMQRAVIYYLLEHATCGTVPSQALVDELLRFLISPRGGRHTISPSWFVEKKSKQFSFFKIG